MAHTKNLVVTSFGVKLAIRHNQLEVWTPDKVSHYILEDINSLIIGSSVMLSSAVIQQLLANKISLMILGDKFTPVYFGRSPNLHVQYAETLHAQMHLSNKISTKLWRNVIKNKIVNQNSTLINSLRVTNSSLSDLADNVKDGDNTNREAVASREYFHYLLDDTGRRSGGDIQSALDYAYTILRGLFIRSLMIHGLEPAIGLFHSDLVNNYGLADDLMEPFRPLIDAYVYQFKDEEFRTIKPKLYAIPTLRYQNDKRVINLSQLIDNYILSYRECVLNNRIKILKIDENNLLLDDSVK